MGRAAPRDVVGGAGAQSHAMSLGEMMNDLGGGLGNAALDLGSRHLGRDLEQDLDLGGGFSVAFADDESATPHAAPPMDSGSRVAPHEDPQPGQCIAAAGRPGPVVELPSRALVGLRVGVDLELRIDEHELGGVDLEGFHEEPERKAGRDAD